jgi:uncharacterized protein (TIGR03437 family)
VPTSFIITALLAISSTAFSADLAPSLQWVKSIGGSGNTTVTAAAADPQGNLYIVGSTTSLDFPTTSATQASPAGSMLVRVNLATAATTRLYPTNLPPVTIAAAAQSDPATLYIASGAQIFKSTDSGATWTMTFPFPSGTIVSDLAVDPTAATTVYASTFTLGVQKSIDGGLTFTSANSGLPPNPNGTTNVSGVWVEPAAPQTIFTLGGFGLARSTDGGATWTVSPNAYGVPVFDPFTPTTLYLIFGSALSKSTDNGQTFVSLPNLPDHAGLLALAPDPKHQGVLYAGSTAGIYQSSDAGLTWTLKMAGLTTLLVADPNSSAFYGNLTGYGIVKSTDGFATTTPVGANQPSIFQLLIAGPNLFEISSASTDVIALKLDNNGNVVYSTYFGGSGSDAAAGLAVGPDGSLYITGSTNSADLPVTPGVYMPQLPSPAGGSFVAKLNSSGSLEWSTYFPASTPQSIAVDSAGEPFIGGDTGGGIPTTPGAYQTMFQQSVTSNGFFANIGPTSAFVTKFNAQGTSLIYSTYVPADNQKNLVEQASALVVDASGNAWIGTGANPGIVPSGQAASVVKLNPTGSAVLASAAQAGIGNVTALAVDAASNVYVAGSYAPQATPFPATPGAFQSVPQPVFPKVLTQYPSGGGQDAFLAKWDSSLTHLLAATLLGGELPDTAASIAIDPSGAVIVSGYTDSKAFPTHAPFQESFSSRSGFVAAFDSNLSNLLFSTYLGDTRPFAARAAVPDGNGNILIAGSTLSQGTTFIGGDNGASFSVPNLLIANKIALPQAPAVRLDSIENYASHIATAIAPGEPITARGAGFGNGAQIVLDGSPLRTLSAASTTVVALVPLTAAPSGVHTVQVTQNGSLSNPVYAPAAAASPAIYTTDNSGAGQAYILNSDDTPNSPSNPAATGSVITILAAAPGPYTISNGYAVPALTPAVFIDGIYCNGIGATIESVDGLPGDVFQLSVFVPNPADLVKNNPDLKNFTFPAQSTVQLVMGPANTSNFANSPMVSQNGIFINIKQ